MSDTLPAVEAASLVPSKAGPKPKSDRPPSLYDNDVLVHIVLSSAPNWVLIDRGSTGEHSASKRHVALTRRGFDVSIRHDPERGVRNTWARWPHPAPTLDSLRVPVIDGDTDVEFFGQESLVVH